MTTVDSILLNLFQTGIEKLSKGVPARDKKILISLSKQINAGHFLTENQGKLLVKILNENLIHLPNFTEDEKASLNSPTWSRSFRVIEQVRYIKLSKDDTSKILVEFTYNKRLKQVMADLNKDLEGQMMSVNSREYSIALTEKNVFNLIKKLKPFGFIIDQKLFNFYEEISKILEKTEDLFNIFEIKNEKLLNKIKEDIGDISEQNILLLNDRRFRYQYQIFPKIHENSLKNSLAQRPSTRVWINSNDIELKNIVDSLQVLKRLPILFVFNGHDSKEALENLKKMEQSLTIAGISDKVGIYFRFDNSSEFNKEFNSQISSLGFNTQLTKDTQVVGISNNKLPKFMISSDWRPNSVITFSNSFKNNKTSLYCDDVDLIIFYNDKKPFGDIDAIV